MNEELIERLEALEEPDRESDCLIAASIGWVGVEKDGRVIGWRDELGIPHYDVPYYTSSLDAALPNEDVVSVSKQRHSDGWVAVHAPIRSDGISIAAHGHTEAIARRIVAFKARAAIRKEEKT